MTAALLLALAAAAAAQSPMPYSGDAPSPAVSTAPAVSTTTAVAASTETVVATSTGGFHVATGGEAKPKLVRPIHATIQPDAKDWEPLSLRAGGDPEQAETKVVLRVAKVRGKYKGAPSKAKAIARLRKRKDDLWLVYAIFPKALEGRRAHFEVRLRLVEGYVENVEASAVAVVDRRPGVGLGLDSDELRARGIEFEEDSPGSGAISISALDPRPSKSAFNAGAMKLATFVDERLGAVDVSWSVKGLPAKL